MCTDMNRDGYLLLDDRSLLGQCQVDTFRASGPGGQKRNKTDSAVRLRHRPTELAVTAVESRSQHENRARALRRLRRAIALNVRQPMDPSRYSPGETVAGCLTKSDQLRVGVKDQRYTRVVAEVLDLIVACRCQVSTAARKMGISTANLVSFIHRDDKLLARVNQMRAAADIGPLR